MNSLLKRGVSGGNVMMQALAAAMSGRSAADFMSDLANTRPELRGLNFSNLEGAARTLCAQRGIDYDSAVQRLTQSLGSMGG